MNCCKLLSWNIRGLRKGKNKRNLRELIGKFEPNIICIQETMMTTLQDRDVNSFWNQDGVKSIFQPANGHSGGILCCWNSDLFELSKFESMENCLGITLKILLSGQCFNIFNVYGPQLSSRKKVLWMRLKRMDEIYRNIPSIIIGDFNYTRSPK